MSIGSGINRHYLDLILKESFLVCRASFQKCDMLVGLRQNDGEIDLQANSYQHDDQPVDNLLAFDPVLRLFIDTDCEEDKNEQ